MRYGTEGLMKKKQNQSGKDRKRGKEQRANRAMSSDELVTQSGQMSEENDWAIQRRAEHKDNDKPSSVPQQQHDTHPTTSSDSSRLGS